MNKKIGIFILATSLAGFLYLLWELMEVSFGFAYFFEPAPPTLQERVVEISLGILWRTLLLWTVLLSVQFLCFKYLIQEKKILPRMVYFAFITLGTSAMVYGYQVSNYVHSEKTKKTGLPKLPPESPRN